MKYSSFINRLELTHFYKTLIQQLKTIEITFTIHYSLPLHST